MKRDEDLQSIVDYSEGQREAAHRVLIELVNIFSQYEDDLRIVGGWVPDLMFPEDGHIGSIDVDVLINHLTLQDEGYQNMSRILQKNGYVDHPDKYFSFQKKIQIHNVTYDVDVDILAGMYGGTQMKKRSQHVQGVRALKATGGNFAFDFPGQKIKIEAPRPDGAIDVAHVNVVAVVPYLIMKTAALGRGKAKDAYDIYFLVKHYHGGIHDLALEFSTVRDKSIVKEMKSKLIEKFRTIEHAGPQDVADFMEIEDGEERQIILRDASERILALIKEI